ncbi:MAG: hypothetical protein M1823_003979 [Watsoniomyces obsoletus]|nr:MAG: hypothetical protein M1823_003979 [Watsoniomyces obsoletus]
MQRAQEKVAQLMHKAGHHDTTVHEKVAPAVVREEVQHTRHDEVQKAVDREVHVDHYHTSIQPIKAREVLPEEHKHYVAPVEERHIDRGNDAEIRARLEAERAQFKDQHIDAGTVHTQSTAPTVVGEHVHHHVHETIQPVLQKEVIQPTVVHTSIPVHEVIHEQPKVHTASALPAVSLSEFQRQGGTLSGREERIDGFEGEPKAVGSALGGTPVGIGAMGTNTTSGPHHSNLANKADPRVDSDRDGSRMGSGGHHVGTDGQIGTATHSGGPHKSSLLNKLDPRVDSNHDGKPGLMK